MAYGMTPTDPGGYGNAIPGITSQFPTPPVGSGNQFPVLAPGMTGGNPGMMNQIMQLLSNPKTLAMIAMMLQGFGGKGGFGGMSQASQVPNPMAIPGLGQQQPQQQGQGQGNPMMGGLLKKLFGL